MMRREWVLNGFIKVWKEDATMELILEHIEKSFKNKKAVNDVNVTLKEGVHGLLGANGSGKTTLLRMICGLLPKDAGSIHFDDIDALRQYDIYASNLGYMPQHFGFYPNYTVYEFLDYISILKNLSKSYSKQRIQELLDILNLNEQRKTKMKHLSGGMLRRVGIAQALLNNPKILILDEPTAGLDPKERIIFRNLIASLSQKCIILLSTHIVSDVETIADDILLMKEGEIVLHDRVDELLDGMRNKVWYISLPQKEALQLMSHHAVVKSHNIGASIELRIVSDFPPHPDAQVQEADLDDLYIYYFKEGETL